MFKHLYLSVCIHLLLLYIKVVYTQLLQYVYIYLFRLKFDCFDALETLTLLVTPAGYNENENELYWPGMFTQTRDLL